MQAAVVQAINRTLGNRENMMVTLQENIEAVIRQENETTSKGIEAKLQELQKKRTEVENMEILQTVHEVAATPEEIRQILEQIRSGKGLETAESQMKEEPKDE